MFYTYLCLSSPTKAARIVMNHSTHVDGLIEALTKGSSLASSKGIKMFVPGRLSRTRGGAAETLQINVSVPISGGFRCLVRRGCMIQELFVSTSISSESELQECLDTMLERK
jgi:hypothetical protein